MKVKSFALILVLIFYLMFPGINSQNTTCKSNVRGKHFIVAFPENYGNNKITTQLHVLFVSFNDRITEVKLSSIHQLLNETYLVKTINVQPRSYERVIIPKEFEIIGTGRNYKSIEIEADFEISVYTIHLEPYTTDGYLAIPTDNLGTQHVVATYGRDTNRMSSTLIYGSQDDTLVSIQITSDVVFESQQYTRGDIMELKLSRLETIQIISTNDLTGSVIISNNPIGVISGHSCINTPGSFCDVLLEQSIPVNSWGRRHFYSATGQQNGTSTYRMVAFFNDTSITGDNISMNLDSGEFTEFTLTGNGIILSTKPASLILILTQIDGSTVDPSLIQVPTENQFALLLGFTTPTHSGASVDGFINFVNIIVKSNESSSLRLNGNEINNTNTSLFPSLVSKSEVTGSDYELLVVRLPREEGVYYITQELAVYSPMSAIAYGYERSETYGYAAGLALPNNQRLLTIFPFYTRLLGGDELSIRLPCLSGDVEVSSVVCKFGTLVSEGAYSGDNEVSCITPPLLEAGFMPVYLSVDSGVSFPFNGLIYAADGDSLTPHISQDREDLILDVSSDEILKWNPELFTESTKLNLGILFLNDPSSDSAQWVNMVLIDEIENSGKVAFSLSEFSSEKKEALGQLRNSIGSYIIREVRTVATEITKFITGKLKIIKMINDTIPSCVSDPLIRNHPGEIPPCPCTTLQASSSANFVEDSRFISELQPGSDICYRSSPTEGGSGQQCCYRDGAINTDPTGAGTADAFSPDISPLRHFQFDLFPGYFCCQLSQNCDLYLQYRPQDDCSNFIPPTTAQTNQDPHFLSLDGLEYTFNGAGEFLLVSSVTNNLTFQARMETLQNSAASVYTGFVIKTENSSKIQVERNILNQIMLYIDDNIFELKDGILLTLIGSEVKIQILDNYSQIVLSFSKGISLRVFIYSQAISFLLQLDKQYENSVTGLLGNFNGNPDDDLALPNGTIIFSNSSLSDIHYNYGIHWMIEEFESLFTYQPPFDYYFYSNRSFTPVFVLPDIASIPIQVRDLCGDTFPCLYDAISTGMLSFANETLQFTILTEEIINNTKSIISCGRPDPVGNGTLVGSVFFAGNRITIICNVGYQINGSAELLCQDDGEWSSALPSCGVMPTDNLLSSLAGYIVLIFISILAVVIIICLVLVYFLLKRYYPLLFRSSGFEKSKPLIA